MLDSLVKYRPMVLPSSILQPICKSPAVVVLMAHLLKVLLNAYGSANPFVNENKTSFIIFFKKSTITK